MAFISAWLTRKTKSQHFCGGGGALIANSVIFAAIPGVPFAYWLSKQFFKVFMDGKRLGEITPPRHGLTTGNNDKFVRCWFEVDDYSIYFNATDYIQAMYTGKKWFPYNKGGSYRKWYGNNDFIVNWQNNGYEICNYKDEKGKRLSRPDNAKYYFMEAITWSKVSSGPISFRFKPNGHSFDVAGCSIICENKILLYLLGVVNSNVILKIIKATAPTLNYEVGQVSNIPILFGMEEKVREVVEKNIELSKTDWDSFETSWDFKKHPLL